MIIECMWVGPSILSIFSPVLMWSVKRSSNAPETYWSQFYTILVLVVNVASIMG